jgi:hypothetical protein
MSPATGRRYLNAHKLPGPATRGTLLALAVLLAGCALAPESGSQPEPSGSATVVSQPSASAEPTAQPTPVSLKGQLTAIDGGPMLWQAHFYGEWQRATREGFVTSAGERIPDKYVDTGYCTDDDGKATKAFGTAEDEIEVLALDGTVLKKLPHRGATAECFQGRYLELQDRMGSFYLYDLDTYQEVPGPEGNDRYDYLHAFAMGEAGYPAYDQESELYGYKGFDGKWLHKPEWALVYEHVAGGTMVLPDRDQDCLARLNASFDIGECLTYQHSEGVGFFVENAKGQKQYYDRDYLPLTDWVDQDAEFSGSYLRIPGHSEWINAEYPEEPTVELPQGYLPIGTDFGISTDGRRAYSVRTQQIIDLPDDFTECQGYRVLGCQNAAGVSVIINRTGKVIDSSGYTVQEAPEAVGGAYLWAIIGNYQGLMDLEGNWFYKESRYTVLQD